MVRYRDLILGLGMLWIMTLLVEMVVVYKITGWFFSGTEVVDEYLMLISLGLAMVLDAILTILTGGFGLLVEIVQEGRFGAQLPAQELGRKFLKRAVALLVFLVGASILNALCS